MRKRLVAIRSSEEAKAIADGHLTLIECCVRHFVKRFRLSESFRDDLLSDAWIAVHRRAQAGVLDEHTSVSRILSIVKWASLNLKRKQEKDARLPEAVERITPDDPILREEFKNALTEKIKRIVGGSDGRVAEVVNLWLRGLNGLETSESLGLNKSLVYRLRNTLRLQIGDAIETEEA